jgi:hypothetical protein
MGLIDELRTVAASLDPSLQPSSNEVGPLLGALIAYTEHGSAVVKAAESDNAAAAVSQLLAGDDAGDAPQAAKPPASSSAAKGDK